MLRAFVPHPPSLDGLGHPDRKITTAPSPSQLHQESSLQVGTVPGTKWPRLKDKSLSFILIGYIVVQPSGGLEGLERWLMDADGCGKG